MPNFLEAIIKNEILRFLFFIENKFYYHASKVTFQCFTFAMFYKMIISDVQKSKTFQSFQLTFYVFIDLYFSNPNYICNVLRNQLGRFYLCIIILWNSTNEIWKYFDIVNKNCLYRFGLYAKYLFFFLQFNCLILLFYWNLCTLFKLDFAVHRKVHTKSQLLQ